MDSIRDALTKSAPDLVSVTVATMTQAKTAVHDRFVALDELCYETFVNYPRKTHISQVRRDVFDRSAERIRQLAAVGGEEYEKAVVALKYCWTDPQTYQEAILVMTPDSDLHNAEDYESSDGQVRHA